MAFLHTLLQLLLRKGFAIELAYLVLILQFLIRCLAFLHIFKRFSFHPIEAVIILNRTIAMYFEAFYFFVVKGKLVMAIESSEANLNRFIEFAKDAIDRAHFDLNYL